MKKNKKFALIFLIAMLSFALIGGCILMFGMEEKEFEASFVYNTEFKVKSHNFYPPDYDADIMNDPDYLKQVPYVYFSNGGITYCITDENYAEYGYAAVLFGEYFDALKSGDTEKYNSLHSERYFLFNRVCDRIAPQRLYNIKVEYIAEGRVSDPLYGDVTKYIYEVSYMIMKNDGSFRSDIGSDAARPLYLEIVNDGNKLFIDACGNNFNYPSDVK